MRELLFVKGGSFSDLRKNSELTSDHFNFHISRLVELGYVVKESRGRYKLTNKGKEYANRLDTDENTIERQPKVAVLLGVVKPGNNATQYLFQKRVKNPYFGYWGFPTGKIRWGETIVQAAERELSEETGLTAKNIDILGVYHERVVIDKKPDIQEDKIFFLIRCTDTKGTLLEKFEGGENSWHTYEQARKLTPTYKSFLLELDSMRNNKPMPIVEQTQFIDSADF